MSSRYQIIECPYKQAEYRKAGLLYSNWSGAQEWGMCYHETSPGVQQELSAQGWRYAVIVEEDGDD